MTRKRLSLKDLKNPVPKIAATRKPYEELEMWRRRLGELMRRRNLKQIELARYLKVSHSAVAHYLDGSAGISIERAKALSDLFGITLDQFLSPEPDGIVSAIRPPVQTDSEGRSGSPEKINVESPQLSTSVLPSVSPSPTQLPTPGNPPQEGSEEPDDMDERRRRLHSLIDTVPQEGLDQALLDTSMWLAEWYRRRYQKGEAATRRGLQ